VELVGWLVSERNGVRLRSLGTPASNEPIVQISDAEEDYI